MKTKSAWKKLYSWIRYEERSVLEDPNTGWCHIPFSQVYWINCLSLNFNDSDEAMFKMLPKEVQESAYLVAKARDRQAKLINGEYAWDELDRRMFTKSTLAQVVARVRG